MLLQSGRTPLHEAASRHRKKDVVDTLINAGADVTIIDEVSCILLSVTLYKLLNNPMLVRYNYVKEILVKNEVIL